MELIKYGIIILGILALVALIIVLARSFLARKEKETEMVITDTERLTQQLSPEELEKLEIQKSIDKIVKTQPESIAKVVRTWMAEDLR